MSDRLTEIRARLDARAGTVTGTNERVVPDGERGYRVEDDAARANQVFHKNAPADIAWLLAEVERWKHVAKNDLYGMCWCDAPRPDCCSCPGACCDTHRGEMQA